jgi:hypothetical protein
MPNDALSSQDARQTLDQLRSKSDSTLRPYNVLVSRNLGNMTITMALPMYQFYGMSAVANDVGLAEHNSDDQSEVAQRKLDPAHAKKLAMYLLRALLENARLSLAASNKAVPAALVRIQEHLNRQPYFATQPIVANLRNAEPGGKGLPVESIAPGFARVFLSDADVLWVIDGQHRRFAMEFLFDFLESVLKTRKYPKRSGLYSPESDSEISPEDLSVWNEVFRTARQGCNVIVDVHLGLSPEQERQIFHDLNNLSKPVAASLAYQFDSSNPVNIFIKEQLIADGILRCGISERDVANWHDDDGSISYKDLVAINARLLLNKTTISSASPADTKPRLETARKFWEAVSAIPSWGAPGAKVKTVAAQPVVLKGIAKVVYDFAFGRDQDEKALREFLSALPMVDLTHGNPCWRYYQMSDQERGTSLPGLQGYLPLAGEGANRDIGGWDSEQQVFRFGAKHNDIFPIVGDILRWMTKLPNRHADADKEAGQ